MQCVNRKWSLRTMILLISWGGVILSSLGGCGEACTLIGCSDSLQITVTDSQGAPVAFSGEIKAGAETLSFACDGSSEVTPTHVCAANTITFKVAAMAGPGTSKQLSITSGAGSAGSWSGPLSPQYRANYPNGEECDVEPVCYSASLELTLQ